MKVTKAHNLPKDRLFQIADGLVPNLIKEYGKEIKDPKYSWNSSKDILSYRFKYNHISILGHVKLNPTDVSVDIAPSNFLAEPIFIPFSGKIKRTIEDNLTKYISQASTPAPKYTAPIPSTIPNQNIGQQYNNATNPLKDVILTQDSVSVNIHNGAMDKTKPIPKDIPESHFKYVWIGQEDKKTADPKNPSPKGYFGIDELVSEGVETEAESIEDFKNRFARQKESAKKFCQERGVTDYILTNNDMKELGLMMDSLQEDSARYMQDKKLEKYHWIIDLQQEYAIQRFEELLINSEEIPQKREEPKSSDADFKEAHNILGWGPKQLRDKYFEKKSTTATIDNVVNIDEGKNKETTNTTYQSPLLTQQSKTKTPIYTAEDKFSKDADVSDFPRADYEQTTTAKKEIKQVYVPNADEVCNNEFKRLSNDYKNNDPVLSELAAAFSKESDWGDKIKDAGDLIKTNKGYFSNMPLENLDKLTRIIKNNEEVAKKYCNEIMDLYKKVIDID